MAALGESAPSELIRWQLAEKYGWTLDYIDSLTMDVLHEYSQVQDGLSHARASIIAKR